MKRKRIYIIGEKLNDMTDDLSDLIRQTAMEDHQATIDALEDIAEAVGRKQGEGKKEDNR